MDALLIDFSSPGDMWCGVVLSFLVYEGTADGRLRRPIIATDSQQYRYVKMTKLEGPERAWTKHGCITFVERATAHFTTHATVPGGCLYRRLRTCGVACEGSVTPEAP